MLRVGPYEVSVLVADRLRLDGGAMFGAIPKTLWERSIAADEKNRIQLVCRLLVLKSSERTVLVDLGVGRKWDQRRRDIYAIEHIVAKPLLEEFEGVTDIILTHLHFDHVGGISHIGADNRPVLSAPKARVYLNKVNWEHAHNCGLREKASYLPENLGPLSKADLRFVGDGEEILPQIRTFFANGHTHGLCWIQVGEGTGSVVYPSDLIPMSHHVPIPYVMGYDLCAETSMLEKERFLKGAVEENWIVVFEHDPDIAAATVVRDSSGRYLIGEVVSI